MKTRAIEALAAVLLLGGTGCRVTETSSNERAAPEARAAAADRTDQPGKARVDSPVIVHLERRDERITVSAGRGGPVYTVASRSGEVLWKELSEGELRAKAPELHQFLKSALAGQSAPGQGILDARIRIIER